MSLSLEEQLDAYPDLPPEARAALHAQVEAERPDLRPALDDAAAIAHLLDALRQDAGRAHLAELAAAHATGTLSISDARRWAALEARARADAVLQAHLDAVQARLATLNETLTDPQAQFERMVASRASSAPSRPAPAAARAARPPVAASRPRLPRWGRALVAASVAVLVLFGVLRLALRPSPYAFTEEEVGTEEFGPLRGEAPPTNPTEARYLDALDALAQAQRSFLGLPLGPDQNTLARAGQELQAVVANTPPGSFVRLEAAYRLGKLRLLQGDVAAARPFLTEVVTGDGRYAPEAAILLEQSEAPR